MSHHSEEGGRPSNLHPNTKRIGVLVMLCIIAPVIWEAIVTRNWGGLIGTVMITDIAAKTLWRWS